jgi:hypothetical protein
MKILRKFDDVWQEMETQGYRYGSDALEQVRFGWDLAIADRDAIVAELEAALRDALDGMLDMRPYVDKYFAEKWGHDDYIARAKATLETNE